MSDLVFELIVIKNDVCFTSFIKEFPSVIIQTKTLDYDEIETKIEDAFKFYLSTLNTLSHSFKITEYLDYNPI